MEDPRSQIIIIDTDPEALDKLSDEDLIEIRDSLRQQYRLLLESEPPPPTADEKMATERKVGKMAKAELIRRLTEDHSTRHCYVVRDAIIKAMDDLRQLPEKREERPILNEIFVEYINIGCVYPTGDDSMDAAMSTELSRRWKDEDKAHRPLPPDLYRLPPSPDVPSLADPAPSEPHTEES